jgi:phosphocarrier protein HPr
VVQREVKVGSQVGLHARPAALVAKAAAGAPVPIMIAKGGEPVNAASLLSLLTLGAGHGDVVTLSAEGEQAEAALEELAALIATDLDA